jgi:hypothetical protein
VLILLDSITRLARAYNTVVPSSGKVFEWAGQETNKEDKIHLELCSRELTGDREIFLNVVKINCEYLKFASKEFRGDREVVLAAIQTNGDLIEFASKELRGDREIALIAVRSGKKAIQFLSDELRKDKEIILNAIKLHGLGVLIFSSEDGVPNVLFEITE